MTKAHNSLCCFECFNERAVLRPRRFSSFSFFFFFFFYHFVEGFASSFRAFYKQKIRRMDKIDDDKDDDSHTRNRSLFILFYSRNGNIAVCARQCIVTKMEDSKFFFFSPLCLYFVLGEGKKLRDARN